MCEPNNIQARTHTHIQTPLAASNSTTGDNYKIRNFARERALTGAYDGRAILCRWLPQWWRLRGLSCHSLDVAATVSYLFITKWFVCCVRAVGRAGGRRAPASTLAYDTEAVRTGGYFCGPRDLCGMFSRRMVHHDRYKHTQTTHTGHTNIIKSHNMHTVRYQTTIYIYILLYVSSHGRIVVIFTQTRSSCNGILSLNVSTSFNNFKKVPIRRVFHRSHFIDTQMYI